MLTSSEIRRKRCGELADAPATSFGRIYRLAAISLYDVVRALFLDTFRSRDDFGTYWGSIFISTSKARIASAVVRNASGSVSVDGRAGGLSPIPDTPEDLPPYESIG